MAFCSKEQSSRRIFKKSFQCKKLNERNVLDSILFWKLRFLYRISDIFQSPDNFSFQCLAIEIKRTDGVLDSVWHNKFERQERSNSFIRPPTNFFSFPKSFSSFPVLKLHFSFFFFLFSLVFSISHSLWLSFISFHLITYVLLSPFVYYLYNCLSVCSISSLFPSHFPKSFSFILKTRLSFQIFQTPLIIHRLFTHCGWEFQFKEWMVKPKELKKWLK
jgi:hypothetical protein